MRLRNSHVDLNFGSESLSIHADLGCVFKAADY